MTIFIDNINKIVTLSFNDGKVYTLSIGEWAFAISFPKTLGAPSE